MIAYVTLGTNDFERASVFYDELLAAIGHARILQDKSFLSTAMPPPWVTV